MAHASCLMTMHEMWVELMWLHGAGLSTPTVCLACLPGCCSWIFKVCLALSYCSNNEIKMAAVMFSYFNSRLSVCYRRNNSYWDDITTLQCLFIVYAAALMIIIELMSGASCKRVGPPLKNPRPNKKRTQQSMQCSVLLLISPHSVFIMRSARFVQFNWISHAHVLDLNIIFKAFCNLHAAKPNIDVKFWTIYMTFMHKIFDWYWCYYWTLVCFLV